MDKIEIKKELHPRNKHNKGYDFDLLKKDTPELSSYVHPNKYGNESVDFFDPLAVKTLNKALLKTHYGISDWDVPEGFLCPPIPGRADYIHYAADLLANDNSGKIPKGEKVKCLDIGVGANCIYPIIGSKEYGWSFTGAEISAESVSHAQTIVKNNGSLSSTIEIKHQENPESIFHNIISPEDYYDVSMCNPPFHSSEEEAMAAATRKVKNLTGDKDVDVVSNFGGQHHELWCEGGELEFISKMIEESVDFAKNVLWFTTLVSKESNLGELEDRVKGTRISTADFRIIPMGQGQKKSRIIAWTFFRLKYRKVWCKMRHQ